MIVDFGDIKDFLNKKIKPLFDHRLILRKDSRFFGLEQKNERIRYVDYQPTTENMLLEIVEIVSNSFKKIKMQFCVQLFSEKRLVAMQNGTKQTNNLIIRWTKSMKKNTTLRFGLKT